MDTWRHLRAILLLPFVVTVVVPGTLLGLTEPDTLGLWKLAPVTCLPLPLVPPQGQMLGLRIL